MKPTSGRSNRGRFTFTKASDSVRRTGAGCPPVDSSQLILGLVERRGPFLLSFLLFWEIISYFSVDYPLWIFIETVKANF
jgi:hypothetical protein